MVAQIAKNLLAVRRPGFDPWVREDPLEGENENPFLFLPGEFHGQMSLAGYSPWGRKSQTRQTLFFFF